MLIIAIIALDVEMANGVLLFLSELVGQKAVKKRFGIKRNNYRFCGINGSLKKISKKVLIFIIILLNLKHFLYKNKFKK